MIKLTSLLSEKRGRKVRLEDVQKAFEKKFGKGIEVRPWNVSYFYVITKNHSQRLKIFNELYADNAPKHYKSLPSIEKILSKTYNKKIDVIYAKEFTYENWIPFQIHPENDYD